MNKFCKLQKNYLITNTVVSFILALICAVTFFCVFTDCFVWFAEFSVVVAFAVAPGTQFLLAGTMLGWIGGFLDSAGFLMASVITISTGYALFFWLLFPWGVIAAFIIAVIPSFVCYKKQMAYINEHKSFCEIERTSTEDNK